MKSIRLYKIWTDERYRGIIKAASPTEARKLARKQYPDAEAVVAEEIKERV